MRHEKSIADPCLKRYSFLHVSLVQNRGLTHSEATLRVNENLLGTLGDEDKGHVNLEAIEKLRDDFISAKGQSHVKYVTKFR